MLSTCSFTIVITADHTQALYCIECTVESVSGRGVTENNLCQLKVVIRCCSPLGTDCPNKFHYSILHDSYWRVLEGESGTALVENTSRTVYINVDVVPQMYGELPLPIVDITKHSRRRASYKGSKHEDVFVPVDKSLVYNTSRGMRVCVYSESWKPDRTACYVQLCTVIIRMYLDNIVQWLYHALVL